MHQLSIESQSDLREIFEKYGFSLDGSIKSPTNLFQEIKDGETELYEAEGELLRFVRTSACKVKHGDYHLVEQNPPGARRELVDMGYSVMGKIMSGENALTAMGREFLEETGMDISEDRFEREREIAKNFSSPSYNHLKCKNTIFGYKLEFTEEEFNTHRRGFVVVDSAGTSHQLKWEQL
jgi:hypothetical protein